MIPAAVKFTGLTVDPIKVLEGRVKTGVIPSAWLRVGFETEHEGSVEKLNKWLYANISGAWAIYAIPLRFGKKSFVIAFEDDNDAVMFRLKGGDTAWNIVETEI